MVNIKVNYSKRSCLLHMESKTITKQQQKTIFCCHKICLFLQNLSDKPLEIECIYYGDVKLIPVPITTFGLFMCELLKNWLDLYSIPEYRCEINTKLSVKLLVITTFNTFIAHPTRYFSKMELIPRAREYEPFAFSSFIKRCLSFSIISTSRKLHHFSVPVFIINDIIV